MNRFPDRHRRREIEGDFFLCMRAHSLPPSLCFDEIGIFNRSSISAAFTLPLCAVKAFII